MGGRRPGRVLRLSERPRGRRAARDPRGPGDRGRARAAGRPPGRGTAGPRGPAQRCRGRRGARHGRGADGAGGHRYDTACGRAAAIAGDARGGRDQRRGAGADRAPLRARAARRARAQGRQRAGGGAPGAQADRRGRPDRGRRGAGADADDGPRGRARAAVAGVGGDRPGARIDRGHPGRGGHRQEPVGPCADRASGRRAFVAVLLAPPQHLAVSGRPVARAPARAGPFGAARGPAGGHHRRRPRSRSPSRRCWACRSTPRSSARRSTGVRPRCARSPRCSRPTPRSIRCCSSSRTCTGPTRRPSSCWGRSRR